MGLQQFYLAIFGLILMQGKLIVRVLLNLNVLRMLSFGRGLCTNLTCEFDTPVYLRVTPCFWRKSHYQILTSLKP